MATITIITDYDLRDHPLRVSVYHHDIDKFEEILCFIKNSGLSLYEIDENINKIRQLYISSINGPNTIITSRFKLALKAFELPLPDDEYDVYDVAPSGNNDLTYQSVRKLSIVPLMQWQKLVANSAVVYHEMEITGILHNEQHRTPMWRQDLVTGRSACSNFNIQGISKVDEVVSIIRTPNTTENDMILHFDWIAADIMIAAYMSQDQALLDAFKSSDPYTYLSQCLGKPRSECKIMLLADLNGINLKSDVFTVYEQLKHWMMECIQQAQQTSQLKTFLGRAFRMKDNNIEVLRKIFNYTLQGGTAHLMNAALCRMRRVPSVKIVADLHDGLALICPKDARVQVLKAAKSIMSKPVSEHDICMAFRVSECKVGDGWHRWLPTVVCKDGHNWLWAESN